MHEGNGFCGVYFERQKQASQRTSILNADALETLRRVALAVAASRRTFFSGTAIYIAGPKTAGERHIAWRGSWRRREVAYISPWEQRLVRSPSRASPTITLLSKMNVTTSTSYSCVVSKLISQRSSTKGSLIIGPHISCERIVENKASLGL